MHIIVAFNMKNIISSDLRRVQKIKLQQTYDDDLSCYYRYKQIYTSKLGVRSSVGKESLGTELSRKGNTRDPENSVCSINPTNFDGG